MGTTAVKGLDLQQDLTKRANKKFAFDISDLDREVEKILGPNPKKLDRNPEKAFAELKLDLAKIKQNLKALQELRGD